MLRKRLFWIGLAVLVLAAVGGGYLYYNNTRLLAQTPTDATASATYAVSRGDIVLTADGSGTLVPTQEVTAAFKSGGTLAEVLVKVGDQVEAGQVLARVDATDARDELSQAEIGHREAQLALETLKEAASASDLAAAEGSLASAKATLATLTEPASGQDVLAARETLKSARLKLAALLDGPTAEDVASAKADLTLAELNVRAAQSAYDQVAWRSDVAMLSQATDLWQATAEYNKAKASYDAVPNSTTAEEISAARAEVASAQSALNTLLEAPNADEVTAAQAAVDKAQADLDELDSGATKTEIESAQLAVDQAQLTLDGAQRALEQTELLAPIAGTVTAVAAEAGELVGTEALVTLADLDEPVVEFWVEEGDLTSVAAGNAVTITFEALPDYSFPGVILSVDPALVEVDSTPAVQAYASVDLSAHPVQVVSGMNATIEVVADEARDVLLAPVDALQTIGNARYAVMVVQADGSLQLRPVEVGLKDYVHAEIRSGLGEGERVSVASAAPQGTPQMEMPVGGGMPPGAMPMGGGSGRP